MNYDRTKPELKELLVRLKEYAAIDYGTEAYPLSKAEAESLLKCIEQSEYGQQVWARSFFKICDILSSLREQVPEIMRGK